MTERNTAPGAPASPGYFDGLMRRTGVVYNERAARPAPSARTSTLFSEIERNGGASPEHPDLFAGLEIIDREETPPVFELGAVGDAIPPADGAAPANLPTATAHSPTAPVQPGMTAGNAAAKPTQAAREISEPARSAPPIVEVEAFADAAPSAGGIAAVGSAPAADAPLTAVETSPESASPSSTAAVKASVSTAVKASISEPDRGPETRGEPGAGLIVEQDSFIPSAAEANAAAWNVSLIGATPSREETMRAVWEWVNGAPAAQTEPRANSLGGRPGLDLEVVYEAVAGRGRPFEARRAAQERSGSDARTNAPERGALPEVHLSIGAISLTIEEPAQPAPAPAPPPARNAHVQDDSFSRLQRRYVRF